MPGTVEPVSEDNVLTIVLASSLSLGPVAGALATSGSDMAPRRDIDLLAGASSVVVVDPSCWRASSSRSARFVARVLGEQWGVAMTAMRVGRSADAVLALSDDIGALCAVVGVRSDPPLLVICHHLNSRRMHYLLGWLRRHRRVDRFLLHSHRQVSLSTSIGVPESRSCVLGLHVDTEFFRPPDATPDPAPAARPLIVAVGATGRDYPTLVEAARGLPVDVAIEAVSIWAGTDDVDRGGAPTNVEFTSLGSTAALRRQYTRAALVAIPLHEVGILVGPTVILEAKAMERPVLVTDISMLGDDLFRDDVDGLRVRIGDAGHWREQVQAILGDPETWHERARAARVQTIEEHRIERYPTRILDAVREVVADRAR